MTTSYRSTSIPGYSVITSNFFTVESLLGVTPANFPNNGDLASNTSEPDNPPSVLWAPSISLTQNSSPYASDVTWTFYSLNGTTIVNSGTGEISLGQFVVETTQNFTSPPYTNGSTIDYSWTVTDNSTGTAVERQWDRCLRSSRAFVGASARRGSRDPTLVCAPPPTPTSDCATAAAVTSARARLQPNCRDPALRPTDRRGVSPRKDHTAGLRCRG